jgi:hypothetical protein
MIVRHYLVARDGRGRWFTIDHADGPAARDALAERAHHIRKQSNAQLLRIGRRNKAAKGQRANIPKDMLRGFRIISQYVMESQ